MSIENVHSNRSLAVAGPHQYRLQHFLLRNIEFILQKCNVINMYLQRYDSVSQAEWRIQSLIFQMKMLHNMHLAHLVLQCCIALVNRKVLWQVCFHVSNLKNAKWAHYLCCLGNFSSYDWLNNNYHSKTNAKIRSLLLAVTSDVAHYPV